MAESEEPPEGYVTQSPDTSYWAERILVEHWRSQEPWEKARDIDDLTRWAFQLQIAGLRLRHPSASESELELRAAGLRLGRDVVRRWTGFDAGD